MASKRGFLRGYSAGLKQNDLKERYTERIKGINGQNLYEISKSSKEKIAIFKKAQTSRMSFSQYIACGQQ